MFSLTFSFANRDRENCTVFVADLPRGTTEEDLTALFKDVSKFCAAIPHLSS